MFDHDQTSVTGQARVTKPDKDYLLGKGNLNEENMTKRTKIDKKDQKGSKEQKKDQKDIKGEKESKRPKGPFFMVENSNKVNI